MVRNHTSITELQMLSKNPKIHSGAPEGPNKGKLNDLTNGKPYSLFWGPSQKRTQASKNSTTAELFLDSIVHAGHAYTPLLYLNVAASAFFSDRENNTIMRNYTLEANLSL